jgi:hypothetical protein
MPVHTVKPTVVIIDLISNIEIVNYMKDQKTAGDFYNEAIESAKEKIIIKSDINEEFKFNGGN